MAKTARSHETLELISVENEPSKPSTHYFLLIILYTYRKPANVQASEKNSPSIYPERGDSPLILLITVTKDCNIIWVTLHEQDNILHVYMKSNSSYIKKQIYLFILCRICTWHGDVCVAGPLITQRGERLG